MTTLSALLAIDPSGSEQGTPTNNIKSIAYLLRAPIQLALVLAVFGSMLVPILITLFWFSTPSVRRRPVFIVNVASILVGIGVAVLGIYDGLAPILSPTTHLSAATSAAFINAVMLAPWLAELVLVFRLAAVFHPSHTSRSTFAAVIAFPVIIKCARLGCCIALGIMWTRKRVESLDNVLGDAEYSGGWKALSSWYLCAELFFQISDNSYLSAIFMWKLRNRPGFHRRASRRVSFGSRSSFNSRLKTLLWIAVGNFLFPILMNIATIIDVLVDPKYVLHAPNLILANYYLSIIGVVFATVWCTSKESNVPQHPFLVLQLSDLPKTTHIAPSPSNAVVGSPGRAELARSANPMEA